MFDNLIIAYCHLFVLRCSAHILKFLLPLTILLNSCGTTQQDGWKLASEFHENYANEFIHNEELLKYIYNPRAHFYFNTHDEAPTFRALIHDTTELRVIIFENQDRFIQEFKLELDTFPSFGEATVRRENGELKLVVDDSLEIEILNFEKDPLTHFKKLRKLINKYGIVTYGKLRIGGIIEVYITANDYLLYFPANYKIEEPQFDERWRKKQKKGKQLDQNWFYYHSDKPLDFG